MTSPDRGFYGPELAPQPAHWRADGWAVLVGERHIERPVREGLCQSSPPSSDHHSPTFRLWAAGRDVGEPVVAAGVEGLQVELDDPGVDDASHVVAMHRPPVPVR